MTGSAMADGLSAVMAGLDPAIHVFGCAEVSKTWITGTSPVMTDERAFVPSLNHRHMPRRVTRRGAVKARIVLDLDLPPEGAKAGALIERHR